jgi:hypothetical protein
MWEPTSHHPFTAQAGSVGLRFRWAGRLGFEL